jgi:hypothetical protein
MLSGIGIHQSCEALCAHTLAEAVSAMTMFHQASRQGNFLI